ncbi:hypothetical protein M9H77_33423 [Catharanthus roseus]|uniref:Uncharacterized protein n=1 Tax=Catharanthus roseus TaxID=4058 RepID=A0ACB9ZIS4_CATRO|nr:hypothetical protein M9H77_33423 [Catharanthus roseus]
MLEYEWGNPSTIMFTTGEETSQEAVDQNRHLFDPYATQTFNETTALLNPNAAHFSTAHNPHHLFHHDPQSSNHAHLNSLYDPRSAAAAAAAYGTSSYGHPNPHHHHHHNQTSMLSLESAGPTGYMVVPKTEPALVGALDFTNSGRIGLNLGGRTYFSSSEDDFVSRLYRRSRVAEPGSLNSPRCQAEGCNADLTNAKHYHRRHKVCEFHSKAATVIAAGLTQRFCQQCSRFHLLSEFDNGKRSCRKRLADHNRRRRKSQQQQQVSSSQDLSCNNKSQNDVAPNSSPHNLSRSPPESSSGGAHSSSVTVAISPPRISLDCFRQRSYHHGAAAAATNSSASTSSLFFSNG